MDETDGIIDGICVKDCPCLMADDHDFKRFSICRFAKMTEAFCRYHPDCFYKSGARAKAELIKVKQELKEKDKTLAEAEKNIELAEDRLLSLKIMLTEINKKLETLSMT